MPIDNALKSTINYYQALGTPDNEIISKMISHPTYSDLGPTVDYHLKGGLSPAQILQKMQDAPVTAKVMPTTSAKVIPGQTPDRYAVNKPVQGSPDELNAVRGIGQPKVAQLGETIIQNPTVPDWKQSAMEQVNNLPAYGGAVGAAAGLAETAGTGGLGVAGIPIAAGVGRVAGKGIATGLTKMLLPQSETNPTAGQVLGEAAQGATEGMEAGLMQPSNLPYAKDVVGREIPNAAKRVVGAFGKGANSQGARALKTDVLDPNVATLGKYSKELNPVGGKLQEQVTGLQEPLMAERNAMVQDATKQGKLIPRSVPEEAIRMKIAEIQQKSPHSTDTIKQAQDFLSKVQETWPEQITPEYAQELKTQLGREIKTWDASLVKDAQSTGSMATKKAMYPELNRALGATTESPTRYGELNKQYSELADLFSKGEANSARNQPAQIADIRTASLPARTRLTEQYIRRPLTKLSQKAKNVGESVQPEPEGLYGGPIDRPDAQGAMGTGITSPRKELPAPEPRPVTSPRKELPPGSYNPQPNGIKRPSEAVPTVLEPAVESARQNDTALLEKMLGKSKATSVPFPQEAFKKQDVEPMLLQQIFKKVGSGEGVNLSAEEKVMLSKAMQDVNIKVENALSGKPRPAVTEHPYEKILNANERSKYMK